MKSLACGLLLSLSLAGGAHCAPAPAPRLALAPCRLPGLEREARCGTYEVFEDRASRSGRKIGLRVVVIPAGQRPAAADPVVYFEGGPGGSAVDSGPGLLEEFPAALRHRDLVLVDARGTGGSSPLICPAQQGVQRIEEALDTFMSPAAAARCREALSRDHDLTRYTTDAIVDDVDEVRAALGYGKVNLLGASYGTRAALVYLRRHPEAVRSALLISVVPQDARVPRLLAPHSQAAFERMARDCAAEPACHKAFPNPGADLRTVLDRLAASPAEVRVLDEEGRERTMRLSRDGAAQTVRYLLYSPAGASEVPVILRRAAAADLHPLAQRAYDLASFFLAAPPDGLYLSVTCAEDVAFVDPEEARRLAAGTFIGDFRVRQQIAACAEWPAARLPSGFLDPVRSAAPVLIFAGENDPTTPLSWAEQVAAALPGSRTLVVPGGAHSFAGLKGIECTDRVAADFLARGGAEGAEKVDLESCRKAIRRAPFLLALDDPKP